jgi:hypothetical protein
MAISVAQNPISAEGNGGRGYFGSGDCVFRVTSSSLAQPNFKFLVQVYDVATLVAQFVIAPNPQSMLMFNLYEVARAYIKPDTQIYSEDYSIHYTTKLPAVTAEPFSRNTTGLKRLEVRFGEKYDVAGVPTEFPGAGTLGADAWQVFFLPWFLQDADGAYPSGLTRWVVGSTLALTNQFMSDIIPGVYSHPESNAWGIEGKPQIPVRLSDYGVIAFPHDVTTIDDNNDSGEVEFTIWNGTTLIGTQDIVVNAANGAAAGTSTNEQDKLIYYGAYPANLSNTTSTINPFYWPDNTFNPNWTHYSIRIKSATLAGISLPVYFVRVESTECRYDNIRLAWANQKGGWDYWNFDKKNEIDWKTDGKTFRKINGTYQNATFKKLNFERGETIFAQDVEKMYTLTSDWLSEEAFTFLRGIFLSKEVHIVNTANLTHIPVTVMDKEYKQRTIRHAIQYNLTFKVKLSQTYNA